MLARQRTGNTAKVSLGSGTAGPYESCPDAVNDPCACGGIKGYLGRE